MKHCLRNTLFLVAALGGLLSSSFAQTAPTTPFAVGVRQYNWTRGSRQITTYVYYPATGTPGGSPVTNAPMAPGVFPICLFQHGFQSSPQNSLGMIRPLAAAGFIVPGPHFPNINIGDISDGDLPRDISQILTNTIALNNAGTPFTGQINTAQVAVSGHSMGGMTVHALLTAYPDSRIKAAIPMSCTDQGTPSSSVVAKVLFMHGDADTTTSYSSGRQAYSEMPPPKAFLTWLGGGHNAMWGDPIMGNVAVEWMRWSLYGDTAARDRLAGAATSDHTRWEFSETPITFPAAGTYSLRSRTSTRMLDNMGRTTSGSNVGQWADGTSNNQRWVLSYVSSNVVKLRCVNGSLYLDGMGRTTNGSIVGQYASGTSNNQRWTIISVGSGYFKLKNVATGLCLDVGASPWANGDNVEQWSDGTSQNQHWQFVTP